MPSVSIAGSWRTGARATCRGSHFYLFTFAFCLLMSQPLEIVHKESHESSEFEVASRSTESYIKLSIEFR